MCKECEGRKEYKSFDELPQELKDKYKGRETKQCKDGYVDFINKLNKNGDKLVSDYINNSTKVRIHYGKCGHTHSEGEGVIPKSYKKGIGCGICHGNIVIKSINDLATIHPKLAKEWHPIKNGDLKPTQVSFGSNKKVWWQCKEGHEWEAIIKSRINNDSNCPYCANQIVLKGFNDIATTHPQYIKYFVNTEDAYTHTHGSNDKVEMKCPICRTIKVMRINNLTRRGFGCSKCGDGISYPEKLMALVLEKLGVEFTRQLTYDNGKHRYDFYIKLWEVIYETHGMQHYRGWSGDKDNLLWQEANDENKRYDAIHYLGIKNEDYNEIDCRYSTLEWCRPNMEKTLSKYIDISILTDEDWEEFDKEAQKSKKVEVCLYWKEQKEANEDFTTTIMTNMFNVSELTIRDWLKWGNESELCTYSSEEERKARIKRVSNFVYLIKPDGTKWYDKAMSQSELSKLTGISNCAIRNRRRDSKPLGSKGANNVKYDSKYIGSYVVEEDKLEEFLLNLKGGDIIE